MRYCKNIYVIFIVLIVCNLSVLSQDKLNDFNLTQLVSAKGYSPKTIIGIDNNFEILLACQEAKTRAQLGEMGIKFNFSQLVLMETWRLIDIKNDTIKSLIPLIVGEDTKKIRSIARSAAGKVSVLIRSDFLRFADLISEKNMPEQVYSTFYSYIVDGLVWDIFREAGLVEDFEITVDEPLWSGEAWGMFPKRKFSCGTNSYSYDDITVNINWSPKAMPLLNPFLKEKSYLDSLVKMYKIGGRFENGMAKTFLFSYGLISANGSITIPVIQENEEDEIYLHSKKMAQKIADKVLEEVFFDQFAKELGFRNKKQAVAIIYNEIMYELIGVFEKIRILSQPIIFSDPDNAKKRNIGEVVFLVDKR